MRTTLLRWVLPGILPALAGCSLAGSWQTIAVDPPRARFPIETITLDRHHQFTATWVEDNRNRTSTGRYEWNGFKLQLLSADSDPRSFGARLHLDGKLVLTHQQDEGTATATLAKVKD